MVNTSSVLLYDGPSLLDGRPVIAVLTGLKTLSQNNSTGDMPQVFFLRQDLHPQSAILAGQDVSICGQCPHRGSLVYRPNKHKHVSTRDCYVKMDAPASIYAAYHRGSYTTRSVDAIAQLLRRRPLRIGAYGDPACAPVDCWFPLLPYTRGHCGYTQQWRTCDPRLRSLVMASVCSPAEAREAQDAGWRTFRCRTADEPLLPRERICPKSVEGGQRTQCAHCRQCDGARPSDARKSIAIIVHGPSACYFTTNRGQTDA